MVPKAVSEPDHDPNQRAISGATQGVEQPVLVDNNSRKMVIGGSSITDQPTGATGHKASPAMLCRRSEGSPHPCQDGQCGSQSIYQQTVAQDHQRFTKKL